MDLSTSSEQQQPEGYGALLQDAAIYDPQQLQLMQDGQSALQAMTDHAQIPLGGEIMPPPHGMMGSDGSGMPVMPIDPATGLPMMLPPGSGMPADAMLMSAAGGEVPQQQQLEGGDGSSSSAQQRKKSEGGAGKGGAKREQVSATGRCRLTAMTALSSHSPNR